MTNHINTEAGCVLVGEYVDEGECPPGVARQSEVVRPEVVANFADIWTHDDGLREFTVLLKDGRILAVRGHGLKHEPSPREGQDTYSIVVRSGEEELLVALFKSNDVSGIFCGVVRSDRKIA